jgi:hypothetical protein
MLDGGPERRRKKKMKEKNKKIACVHLTSRPSVLSSHTSSCPFPRTLSSVLCRSGTCWVSLNDPRNFFSSQFWRDIVSPSSLVFFYSGK